MALPNSHDVMIPNVDAALSTNPTKVLFYKIATEADFLIVNSSTSSHPSFRPLLIAQLCETLKSIEVVDKDLLSLLTVVQRKVAIEHSTGEKQMPCVTSMLTRKIYFKSKDNQQIQQRQAFNLKKFSCFHSNTD